MTVRPGVAAVIFDGGRVLMQVIHYVSSVFECAVRGGRLTCCRETLELGWFDPDALPEDIMLISTVRIRDALARQVGAFVR